MTSYLTSFNPGLTFNDASGPDNSDNAGTADTLIIELGDTVVRADQFQESISALEAYVVKCADSAENFMSAFKCVDGSGYRTISYRLNQYFNDADASARQSRAQDLTVVNNRDASNVIGNVAAVISNTVDIPMDQISPSLLDTAWASWIIPTLFEGKLYGVVRGDGDAASRNDGSDQSVSNDGVGSGNIESGSGDTFEDKDVYIKRMLRQMGVFDNDNEYKTTGIAPTGKRVIFLATLVAGQAQARTDTAGSAVAGPNTGTPNTLNQATTGSRNYNASNQNTITASPLGTSTRIALEFKQ